MSNISYHFDLMFIVFMECLYYHPHFTDQGIDPDTTSASSRQKWDLKTRPRLLVQCFPHLVSASWAKPGLLQSPENLKLAASCWQGIPSRLLVLLLQNREFQKPGGWMVHRGSILFFFPPSSWKERMSYTFGGGGRIMKNNNS